MGNTVDPISKKKKKAWSKEWYNQKTLRSIENGKDEGRSHTMMEVRISWTLMPPPPGPWGLFPAPMLPIRLARTGGNLEPPAPSGEPPDPPGSRVSTYGVSSMEHS
jgi:hypothetical protein